MAFLGFRQAPWGALTDGLTKLHEPLRLAKWAAWRLLLRRRVPTQGIVTDSARRGKTSRFSLPISPHPYLFRASGDQWALPFGNPQGDG